MTEADSTKHSDSSEPKDTKSLTVTDHSEQLLEMWLPEILRRKLGAKYQGSDLPTTDSSQDKSHEEAQSNDL